MLMRAKLSPASQCGLEAFTAGTPCMVIGRFCAYSHPHYNRLAAKRLTCSHRMFWKASPQSQSVSEAQEGRQ